jgi:hypothetical protein
MSRHRLSVQAVVDVPPAAAYAVIADYRAGHPRIIPRPPFGDLEVEQGGVGAGTTIRFQMRAFGRTTTMRAAVTEPEPGRVLVETDPAGKVVTTFTVEPEGDSTRSRVTIATDLEVGGRLTGWLRRFLATRILRRVYAREIALLGEVAAEWVRR